jgi:hypothetical protein
LKSFFSSEWLITWRVPTLFAGSVVAAIAPPPSATSNATLATTIDGESRFTCDPFTYWVNWGDLPASAKGKRASGTPFSARYR